MTSWNINLSHYLAELIIKEWQKSSALEWSASSEKMKSQVHFILNEELNKEKNLDREVHRMLDELEKTHTGQFERYKMYPLLKKKLAEQKGVIL